MKEVLFPEMPYEEYRRRIERLKDLMKKHQLDGLCLFSPINLRYYFGYRRQVMALPNGGGELPSSTQMVTSASSSLKFMGSLSKRRPGSKTSDLGGDLMN